MPLNRHQLQQRYLLMSLHNHLHSYTPVRTGNHCCYIDCNRCIDISFHSHNPDYNCYNCCIRYCCSRRNYSSPDFRRLLVLGLFKLELHQLRL